MIRPSIQIPWHISRATRAMMAPTIIALEFVGDFWTTWSEVYSPKSRASVKVEAL